MKIFTAKLSQSFFFFFFGNMKKIYKFNVFYNNLKKNFTNLSGNKTISNFQELFLFSNKFYFLINKDEDICRFL
ncbi:hypothetical protein DR103_03840 [Mycoplasma hyorhinis]|nr:hypothetical protein [Mesomycoplasma hyorhinis]